jgi:predicted Fe-S protein YdhL (DUF1289 family)
VSERGGIVEPAAAADSPCTLVCTLNADDVCLGCGRTLDEIAAWGSLPRAARERILRELPSRIAGRRG